LFQYIEQGDAEEDFMLQEKDVNAAASEPNVFDFSKIGMRPRYFSGYKLGVTEIQIKELENHYGHELPEHYKCILKNYHGGMPEAKDFGATDEDTGVPLGYELHNFFIVDEHTDRPLNIFWAIKNYSNLIGPGTLPFADDGYNRIYYMRWDKNAHQVWALKFMSEDELETYFLMNSFDELLGALYNAD
jgi:hypothetical protein